ncbi:MAG: YeeE/YedE family protein [Candidatus Binatia bacterium]
MTFAETNLIGGFVGGILIGIASVLLLATNGRIAGVSGVLAGILFARGAGERMWRVAFVTGLVVGAWVYSSLRGGLPLHFQTQGALLVIAGLLVGFGTRLGSGCTSGHGVCGLARRSPRSLAATATFMAVAIGTVFIARHVLP